MQYKALQIPTPKDEAIRAEILQAQLNELLRLAKEHSLNDARDWLIQNMQRTSSIL